MANPWDFETIWFEHTDDYPTFIPSSAPVYVPTDGTLTCAYLSGGEVRKLESTFSGLGHLEGQIISVTTDGVLPNPTQYVVASGEISLTTPAAVIHVGLPYTAKLQLLPLGGDTKDVSDTKIRKVYDVVLRVFQSLGGKFGKDEDHTFPIIYPDNTVLPFNGDIHETPFESSWDDVWQPVLIQDEALPFMLLAMVIRSEISEDK